MNQIINQDIVSDADQTNLKENQKSYHFPMTA